MGVDSGVVPSVPGRDMKQREAETLTSKIRKEPHLFVGGCGWILNTSRTSTYLKDTTVGKNLCHLFPLLILLLLFFFSSSTVSCSSSHVLSQQQWLFFCQQGAAPTVVPSQPSGKLLLSYCIHVIPPDIINILPETTHYLVFLLSFPTTTNEP